MSLKPLLPVLLVAALSGCASATSDPTRARVLADLEQAKADGTYPLTEAQYVYPNWVAGHKTP